MLMEIIGNVWINIFERDGVVIYGGGKDLE